MGLSDLKSGCSATSGVRRSSCELRLAAQGSVLFRAQVALLGPLVTLVLRGSPAALPSAVVGELAERLFEGLVTLPAGARVMASLGGELGVETSNGAAAQAVLRVDRYLGRELVAGARVHETFDVSLSTVGASAPEPREPLAGAWIQGDRLGFAILHPSFRARVRALAGPDRAPLDFLTADARADELLAEGWVLPFLGVRTLWSWRVLAGKDRAATRGLPLGVQVLPTRQVALRPSAQHELVGGESLWLPSEPARKAAVAGLGGGRFALDTFVAGGELATFVLTPSDAAPDAPVEPIMNCDMHARWSESPGGEPLCEPEHPPSGGGSPA